MLIKRIETIATADYEVGDVISFELKDGEKVEAMAVKKRTRWYDFYLGGLFVSRGVHE